MVVIKIGGSLLGSSYLKEWLTLLSNQSKQKIIIVPGGGPFAEQVRIVDKQCPLPEETSHAMAVLAMQQYAYMLHGLQGKLSFVSRVDDILADSSYQHAYIWLPYDEVMATNELVRHWQTTSDSIALWLATKVQAKQLFLVKSASLDNKSAHELAHSDIVDEHFSSLLENFAGTVEFMHASEADQLLDKLIA